MARKEFWLICLAVLAIGSLIYWQNSRENRQEEINSVSRSYTERISDYTILHGEKVPTGGTPDIGHTFFVKRWLDAKDNFIYECEVLIGKTGFETEIRRYKLSSDLDDLGKLLAYGLFDEIYNRKQIVEYEERFVLSDSSVVCREYQKFCRKDGRPFTSCERDAGESVGIMLENWDSDSLYWDENDWSVMEHCRDVLKSLDDLIHAAPDKK